MIIIDEASDMTPEMFNAALAMKEKRAPADEIAALQARVTELEGLLKRWITVAENCQIESGVCGCGADIDNHPHDNHGPADYGTYVALKLAEDTRTALKGADNDRAE